jgi:hypothetical protein
VCALNWPESEALVSEEHAEYATQPTEVAPELTEEQFIARCRTIYRLGHATHAKMRVLERWTDMIGRLQSGQLHIFAQRLREEERRTDGFSNPDKGANDSVGYGVVYLAAVLCHPCQACAEDDRAWHTRAGSCKHRKEAGGE